MICLRQYCLACCPSNLLITAPFTPKDLDLDNICMVFQVYRCWRTDLKIRKVNSENSGLTRNNIMALLKGGTEGPLEMCGQTNQTNQTSKHGCD